MSDRNGNIDKAANVEELEIKVAFLEDSLATLSDEFYIQQRGLKELTLKYETLLSKLVDKSGDDGSGSAVIDEPPPHY